MEIRTYQFAELQEEKCPQCSVLVIVFDLQVDDLDRGTGHISLGLHSCMDNGRNSYGQI